MVPKYSNTLARISSCCLGLTTIAADSICLTSAYLLSNMATPVALPERLSRAKRSRSAVMSFSLRLPLRRARKRMVVAFLMPLIMPSACVCAICMVGMSGRLSEPKKSSSY